MAVSSKASLSKLSFGLFLRILSCDVVPSICLLRFSIFPPVCFLRLFLRFFLQFFLCWDCFGNLFEDFFGNNVCLGDFFEDLFWGFFFEIFCNIIGIGRLAILCIICVRSHTLCQKYLVELLPLLLDCFI